MKKEWIAFLGVVCAGGIAGYFARNKEVKKQREQLAKSDQELNELLEKEKEFLANLANERHAVEVELEDGKIIDFGEYLDKYIAPEIFDGEELEQFLKS